MRLESWKYLNKLLRGCVRSANHNSNKQWHHPLLKHIIAASQLEQLPSSSMHCATVCLCTTGGQGKGRGVLLSLFLCLHERICYMATNKGWPKVTREQKSYMAFKFLPVFNVNIEKAWDAATKELASFYFMLLNKTYITKILFFLKHLTIFAQNVTILDSNKYFNAIFMGN